MKILMTADTLGGVWTHTFELGRWLTRRGAEVTIATSGAPPTNEQRAAVRREPGLELCESSYRLEWQDDSWADLERAGEWLLGVESRGRFDAVHLSGFVHGALRWRAPALIAAHLCALSWWSAVHPGTAFPRTDRYRHAVVRGLAGARAVVTPTLAMLRGLRDHYGQLPHGRVIPLGAPVRSAGATAQRTAPPGTAEKASFVLSAGRLWDRAKNIEALISAAAGVPWPVFVAGRQDGPDRVLHASNTAVRAIGHLSPPALQRWMVDASIYAQPSYYEPFGMAILEAAREGCALVLGDIGSLREAWGDAALYVAPDDHAALTHALARLIQDQRLRAAMSARAQTRARIFSLDRMGHAYLALYREVTGASASRIRLGA